MTPPAWPDLVRARLMWGADRPRTLSSLAEQMQTSRRTIEAAIQELRLTGAPVCTGPNGAYLSTDPAELRQHADRLRSRAIHVLLGARALRATARRHEKVQQQELWAS